MRANHAFLERFSSHYFIPGHFRLQMPSYKLTYFDTQGFAEVSRQLFILSDTPFESHERTGQSTPFGKMPVLEVDGKQLPQSFAIARYLARKFGYAGKTEWEEAWVDALGDQFKDYLNELLPFLRVAWGTATGDLEELRMSIGEPVKDKFFGILEKQAESCGSGFLVGCSLTWIDLVIVDHMDVVESHLPSFFHGFPSVERVRKSVTETEKIKKWRERRPKRPY
ncbi:hypothetical protein PRIPAC_93083 [Pristionchus pacificus]|uniref:glutathione transferase n=1 Tax=Pristionchus pacificus TaxID=54126 RepID=A0A2A6BPR3_PRIPA|nr:hypothetical protein PRIPAC_93083 [Pristionchus pacificus]|eukprot:PDM67942.1 Glutathione S-transferase [Pristionchus pacificus]